MKYQDEYRDPELAGRIIRAIGERSRTAARLMEICGTHTMAIFRAGIRSVLPETITLISGPGCPVCVTAAEDIDRAVALCRQPGVIVATFGDLMRVPGSESSLNREKARGADVRVVYAGFDALEIARQNPQRRVVMVGIGFETTAPTIAATVRQANREGLQNFFLLSAHKLLPPAMEVLLAAEDVHIDGFLCPGHVTTIIGIEPYRKVAQQYGKPCVVSGFEPVDILQSIYMLISQVESGESEVEIQYSRAVNSEGNERARKLMAEVFDTVDASWRGLGSIPGSGLRLKRDFREHDAELHFDLEVPTVRQHPGCRCGEVLRGSCTPVDCPLFRSSCTPSNPYGPCMVSSEGTCAAYYQYHGV
ncbi:MAG: hydrogenase formation protein HypD [Deltaproteobacteria bacterium]|nr:hydrogenase formation protein HypD [Deltaproteobacteria bacterium]MBW2072507.1 hydrogenase formation protein HypD [Deltaproteobacteria bacterium]